MDIHNPRSSSQTLPSMMLSNGYILPKGEVTPNTLFVGVFNQRVDENEIRDVFARYGSVREVKMITDRRGISKGYGFVYFSDDINIQSIVEQQISLRGRKLKLGPAILKERNYRSMPSRLFGPAPWMSPTQYFSCSCCSPMGGGMTPPSPIINGGGLYSLPYSYSNFGEVMIPQMSVNYSQDAYAYQSYVDCGVQPMMTVL